MSVNFNALAAPDIGGAFQQGLQHGRQQKQQMMAQHALSAFAQNPSDPGAVNALFGAGQADLAFKIQKQQQEAGDRAALAKVFAPQTAPAAAPQAPGELIHPTQLPPRTDGLNINKAALQQLYSRDPQAAFQIQKMVFDSDAVGLKRMQDSGKVFASAAYHLSKVADPEQRKAMLAQMTPALQQVGVTPEMIAQADLSDAGLQGYMATGQNIGALIDDERADETQRAQLSNMEADNARSDRVANNSIATSNARLGLARASRAESHVRFKERDKDRAALSGRFGVTNDLSDLDY